MPRNVEIELGLAANVEQPYLPTLTASATTTLTKWYPEIALALTSSGTAILKLANPALWNGKRTRIKVVKTAGTGQCTLQDAAGNDLIGDNFSAVNDYAIVENVGGVVAVVIKEVTT